MRAGRILSDAGESMRGNLTSNPGRTAAYKHGRLTWDEMMRSNQESDGRLAGVA